MQQVYFNDLLADRGYVFLNEVYDALGLPGTAIGAIVGWFRDSDIGDRFVDITIVEENEHGFLLDFNVNGAIFHKLDGGVFIGKVLLKDSDWYIYCGPANATPYLKRENINGL